MSLRIAFFLLVMCVSCLIGYLIVDPHGWTTDLFFYMHQDRNKEFDNPLLQTTYLSINNKAEYFQSNKMQNIDMDLYINNSTIPMNKIRDKWQFLFYDIFIKYEFLPSFENTQYEIDTLNNTNTFDMNNNIELFNQLLQESETFFLKSSNINIENKQFILIYHRQIISIRRYIMILYKYLLSKIEEYNTDITSINTQLYDILIQNVFVKIRILYKDIMQNDEKYNKYWYLIHVSKSAGTSICQTQRTIGYKQLKDLGTNCNIPGHGVPMKNEDIGDLSCSELEYIRETENIEFMASERPMTGYTISNKPTLCNKYHYILPIRDPLRRIASTLSEYNTVRQYFPFQILIKYGQNGKNGFNLKQYRIDNKHQIKCLKRLITLNNITYG
eukprot:253528_1